MGFRFPVSALRVIDRSECVVDDTFAGIVRPEIDRIPQGCENLLSTGEVSPFLQRPGGMHPLVEVPLAGECRAAGGLQKTEQRKADSYGLLHRSILGSKLLKT